MKRIQDKDTTDEMDKFLEDAEKTYNEINKTVYQETLHIKDYTIYYYWFGFIIGIIYGIRMGWLVFAGGI
jgi:hypothetical protein